MLLRGLVIGLTLAVSLSALAQQSPPSAPPSAQGTTVARDAQGQTAGDKNTAAQGAPVLNPPQPKQDQESGGSGSKDRDRVRADESGHEDYNRTIANFTIALAIATIILAVATSMLWWETRKLAARAREASEDTKASIEIAERSAKETARAAQAAIDALGADRPWMFPEGFNTGFSTKAVVAGVEYPSTFVFAARWKNGGRSPALKAHIFLNYECKRPDEPVPTFEVEPHDDEGIIGPNHYVSSAMAAIGGKQLEDFKQGKIVLYVYSKIWYVSTHNMKNVCSSEICAKMVVNGFKLDENGKREINVETTSIGQQNRAV